jgi:hypothetical protein
LGGSARHFPPVCRVQKRERCPGPSLQAPRFGPVESCGGLVSESQPPAGTSRYVSLSHIVPGANINPTKEHTMALLGLGILLFSVSFLCYRHPPSSWSFLEWLRRRSIQNVARKQQGHAPAATNHDRQSESKEKVPEITMNEPPAVDKAEYAYISFGTSRHCRPETHSNQLSNVRMLLKHSRSDFFDYFFLSIISRCPRIRVDFLFF